MITDFPTPVSPDINTFLSVPRRLFRKNLYFTVSVVGTRMLKYG